MGVFGWLLGALIGWTAIGVLGTVLACATSDRQRAWRGLGWLVGVWVIYLAVLLGVSARQRQRIVPAGQEECFAKMCFAVVGVGQVGEFKGESGGRLVQVGVRVRNTGEEKAWVEGLRGYVVAADGRRWAETRGVGGNGLTVRLPPGGSTVSAPVFRVPEDAGKLGLVLTRDHAGLGWLTIGNTDSMGHRRTVMQMEHP